MLILELHVGVLSVVLGKGKARVEWIEESVYPGATSSEEMESCSSDVGRSNISGQPTK
jgi:hypothetical protein